MSPDKAIAQEEVFGPVLVLLPYDDDTDAVRLANGTAYELSAEARSPGPGHRFHEPMTRPWPNCPEPTFSE